MKQNRQQRAYEAPSFSTEEVRIEKAFLADTNISGTLPDHAEPGVGDDGNVDDWFTLQQL